MAAMAMACAAGVGAADNPEQIAPLSRPSPAAGQFVTARDGHFFLDDKRLRLWGYNLQAGVFNDYAAIRNVASRLGKLEVNSVRLWPTMGQFYGAQSVRNKAFMDSSKGDGSPLDKYDFMIAELKQRGIFVHNTALHYMGADVIGSWPDPEVQEIVGPKPSTDRVRRLHVLAPYLSAAYERMLTAHIKNYLRHVNAYTGHAYAREEVFSAWELANESNFVYCMFDRRCIDGLPAVLQRQLRASWSQWQGDRGGEASDALPPFDASWDKEDIPLHRRYREFVVTRFMETSRRLEKIAREQAPDGGGIAVQPISYNTHAGAPLAAAHAASSGGDFVAVGLYQTPTTADKAAPRYPWSPFLGKGPRLYNFNYGAVSGKPLVVYETSFFRPYPYRTEWGPMMLGLATSQDWDAVYLFMYGQPKIIYSGNGEPESYGTRPLPEPTTTRPGPGDYTFGFHHGGDEVVVASWMAAGFGFIAGDLVPAPNPATYRFGKSDLYGLSPGYCAGPAGCGRGKKQLIAEMYDASLSGKLRLELDGNSEATGCAPCLAARPAARTRSSEGSVWDLENVRAIFDSPTYKSVSGDLQGTVAFSGGIEVSFNKAVFGTFAIVSADGRPIARSGDLRMVASGSAENSGFAMDSEKIDFKKPQGAIAGLVNAGQAPVVVTRPEVDVVLPGWSGQLQRFDFSLRAYDRGPAADVVHIRSGEPFFLGRLVRSPLTE